MTHTTVKRDECVRWVFSTAVENQHSFSVPLLPTSCLKAVHVSSDCLIDRSLAQSDIHGDEGSFESEGFPMPVEMNTTSIKTGFSKGSGKIDIKTYMRNKPGLLASFSI